MAGQHRWAAAGAATLLALGLSIQPGYAATTRPAAPPKPVTAPPAPRVAAILPPQITQISPAKVNPTVQPNIMILGQHLTPASTVQVGIRPATTLEAADSYHLLIKLPDNLSKGTYVIAVRNEAGTAVASDLLVVDDSSPQPSTLKYGAVVGFLVLLVLVMRLARTPGWRSPSG